MARLTHRDIAVITFNQVPRVNLTYKYDVLGQLALENRRQYCVRHGYTYIRDVAVAADRPACWAKIPALLSALETHQWALWADSDALIFAPDKQIESLCDPGYDMVVQSHDDYFRLVGVPLHVGYDRMPINTGVFLVRSSPWSRSLLREAYEQTQFISRGEVWDGIGEQEAITALLRRAPEDRARIKYVLGLQSHPKFYQRGDFFVHFYGNHAPNRIPLEQCDEVIGRWGRAVHKGGELPLDRARFHWCCIQNKRTDAPRVRGDLSMYLYGPADIHGS